MRFGKLISRFGGDESGAILIWAALSSPMILGIGALAFDMNQMYTTKAQLQHTADAAAMAAAKALPDMAAAIGAAQQYAQLNMPSASNGTVVAQADVITGNWDSASRTFTPAGAPVNAVRVNARRDQQNGNPMATSIAAAIGVSSVNLSASSTAAQSGAAAGNSCLIALSQINTSASKAFYLQGNGSVKTYGCDIQVNSCNSTDALKGQGNTYVELSAEGYGTGGRIKVCGEVLGQGPAYFYPEPTYPDKNNPANVVPDPYAGIANPAYTYSSPADCTYTNYSSSDATVTLTPGIYCGGITLTGGGSAIFQSSGGMLDNGLYVIKDGPLSIGGSKTIEADGVTFFMTGAAANINFSGTADIHITAPTGGDHAGFVVFSDRDAPATNPHLMRGTPLGGYDGKIYLPKAKMLMQGTAGVLSGALSDCTVVVADTFEFLGTPNFEASGECSSYGGSSPAGIATIVK